MLRLLTTMSTNTTAERENAKLREALQEAYKFISAIAEMTAIGSITGFSHVAPSKTIKRASRELSAKLNVILNP